MALGWDRAEDAVAPGRGGGEVSKRDSNDLVATLRDEKIHPEPTNEPTFLPEVNPMPAITRIITRLGLLAALALASDRAYARPRHHVPAPGRGPGSVVTVWFDPWVIDATPAPRDGWRWVNGHYDAAGNWVPGHWVPAEDRPGWVWVEGYWEADGYYVEGYWRPATRTNRVWVDGHYDRDRRWVSGRWVRQ